MKLVDYLKESDGGAANDEANSGERRKRTMASSSPRSSAASSSSCFSARSLVSRWIRTLRNCSPVKGGSSSCLYRRKKKSIEGEGSLRNWGNEASMVADSPMASEESGKTARWEMMEASPIIRLPQSDKRVVEDDPSSSTLSTTTIMTDKATSPVGPEMMEFIRSPVSHENVGLSLQPIVVRSDKRVAEGDPSSSPVSTGIMIDKATFFRMMEFIRSPVSHENAESSLQPMVVRSDKRVAEGDLSSSTVSTGIMIDKATSSVGMEMMEFIRSPVRHENAESSLQPMVVRSDKRVVEGDHSSLIVSTGIMIDKATFLVGLEMMEVIKSLLNYENAELSLQAMVVRSDKGVGEGDSSSSVVSTGIMTAKATSSEMMEVIRLSVNHENAESFLQATVTRSDKWVGEGDPFSTTIMTNKAISLENLECMIPKMDLLELELQIKLERMQFNLEEGQESSQIELTGESNEPSGSCSINLQQHEVHGIDALELERRLHEHLEAIQQARIWELESALESAEKKIQASRRRNIATHASQKQERKLHEHLEAIQQARIWELESALESAEREIQASRWRNIATHASQRQERRLYEFLEAIQQTRIWELESALESAERKIQASRWRNIATHASQKQERKLHELLEAMQQARIWELESALDSAEREIHASRRRNIATYASQKKERRLHELLEVRQQARISELEYALESAESRLQVKEIQASWWRNIATQASQNQELSVMWS